MLNPYIRKPSPLLLILSGPSGVGKDVILSRMKELGYPFFYAVTATTRPKRPEETHGADYYFVGRDGFEEMIEKGVLLEWASVYGYLYGVPRKPLREALNKGTDVIVKVDVQGAATIKRIAPESVSILISPPSMEELERRLRERKTESVATFERRLNRAQQELDDTSIFDYIAVSETGATDLAISQILAIVTAEKCRAKQRQVDI